MSSKTTCILALIALLSLLSVGAAPARPADSTPDPTAAVSLAQMRFDGEKFSQILDDGRKVVFTVDPDLQRFADQLFEKYEVPAGAAVVLNSRTGRVLAMSSHRSREYAAPTDLVALDPSPPAASLFKVVTTAALIEQTDTTLDTRICYHGGGQRLGLDNLKDSEKFDTACASLSHAFGRSINSIFAKLSDRKLDQRAISDYAGRFRFGKELPFDVDVPVSLIEIPEDRLERARTAAGFWHSHLSPLHAAMISQAIAQKGAMLQPYIVDHIESADGTTEYSSSPKLLGRPVAPETASALLEAMKQTVAVGTARKSFRDSKGIPYLGDIQVAGKTGTLHGSSPFRAYSWFMGVAPADDPEISFAVLVVNEPKWRIKSAPFAVQLLQKYFADRL